MSRVWLNITVAFWAAFVVFSFVPTAICEDSVTTDSNVVLYTISFCEEKPTLVFDGWRVEPFAKEVKIVDKTETGITGVSELSDSIGLGPDWDSAKIGDTVGLLLGDAIYADVVSVNNEITELTILRRESRPLIGVSWIGEDKVGGGQRVIADSLMRHGARPFLIPQIKTEADCEAYLPKLKGFVMPGGTNFNPHNYGEEPYPHGSNHIDVARDMNDILVTRWIVSHNVPGFWICRGVQALNVALGGGLIQDVPTYLAQQTLQGKIPLEQTKPLPDDGAPGFEPGDPKTPCVAPHFRVNAYGIAHVGSRHAISIADEFDGKTGSKFLRSIVGAAEYPSVLTSHHQAANPERVADGLTVVAHSPDGIIEALEYQANTFALGTQFHPEYDTKSPDTELQRFGNSFFKTFLYYVRTRR